jgi:hypothetical protein
VELRRFPDVLWRLNWLGAIKPEGPRAPFGYRITAQFVSEGAGEPRVLELPVPLGALPKLALGSMWRNEAVVGFVPTQHAAVSIDFSKIHVITHPAVDPYSVLPPSVYSLRALKDRSWCRVIPTLDGPELIIPHSEVLRAWYGFDARVMPFLASNGVEQPATTSRRLLLYQPEGTYLVPPRSAQITYPSHVSEDLALRLARLVLDPAARPGVRAVHRAFVRSAVGQPIPLPHLLPPNQSLSRLDVRYVPVPPYRGAPERRLVLGIDGGDLPLPWDTLIPVALGDNRKGEDKADTLAPIRRNTTEVILPPDGALDIYGTAADAKLATVSLMGFGFRDNASHVRLARPAKTEQRAEHAGRSGVAITASGVSVDPTADAVDGRPGVGDSIAPKLPPHVLQLKMKEAFDGIIDSLRSEPAFHGWTARYFEDQIHGIRLVNIARDEKRPYLILHFTNGLRHLYLIEAGKVREWESFCLFLGERMHGGQLSNGLLRQWLSDFPHPTGSHWMPLENNGLHWLPDYIVHQPRRRGQDEATLRQKLVKRLVKRVLAQVV